MEEKTKEPAPRTLLGRGQHAGFPTFLRINRGYKRSRMSCVARISDWAVWGCRLKPALLEERNRDKSQASGVGVSFGLGHGQECLCYLRAGVEVHADAVFGAQRY